MLYAIPGVKNDGKKSLVALWPWLLFLKHPMHGLGLEKELSYVLSFELEADHGTPGQH